MGRAKGERLRLHAPHFERISASDPRRLAGSVGGTGVSERFHFSTQRIKSVTQHREYSDQVLNDKPEGFWFSVQTGEPDWTGWFEWCRAENFRDIDTQKSHRIEVDPSRMLCVGPADLRWFNETFGERRRIGDRLLSGTFIRWDLVADQFAGIEISPYAWDLRDSDLRWYYGWDCASGCIWDTSIIKSIEEVPLSDVPVTEAPRSRPTREARR